ncbi:helix-turn-helix domain-containing protein [Sphingomonas sp. GCM10030256]|uniref:helix-turn-helix domain-containing protein n=1 Tax=Sphingomonas sp. GCM10030256 TaxID=3273427 RepID=UPI003611213B
MVDEAAGIETTVGERLKAAREAQDMSLEDVAARTRIPTRHLESIEASAWDKLPAPTYSIGFAKSYASAVGLDRTEVGDQLRAEMGGTRPQSTAPDVFEPADPARVMPKWLVIGAVVAVGLLIAALLFLRERSLEADDAAPVAVAGGTEAAPVQPAAAPAPAAAGPVVITANEPVWIQVYERAGQTLFQGELRAGQSFEVPASATAPLLRTGKPEALRVSVGTADAPAIGPAATTVRDVSLLGPELMRGSGATAPAATTPARR